MRLAKFNLLMMDLKLIKSKEEFDQITNDEQSNIERNYRQKRKT